MKIKPAARARGLVVIPGDKSISHRALILASLTSGVCTIENLSSCEDIQSTIGALRSIGVNIQHEHKHNTVKVHGTGGNFTAPEGQIDCGNSGTTMRLMMGLLASQDFESTLIGDESLSGRPMKAVADPLIQMGAGISLANDNYAPVKVHGGTLHGISYSATVVSAQMKSAVILAGLMASGSTIYHETLPTRDHTERMLSRLYGSDLITSDKLSGKVQVNGGRRILNPFDIVIPGDASSAAFPIALGSLLPESSVTVPFTGLNPGRIAFYRHLQAMGGVVVLTPDASATSATAGEPVGDISVQSAKLRNVPIDPERIPALIDEIPLISIIACVSDNDWEITGARRLREKETDRIRTTAIMLRALGIEVEELDDGLRGPGNQILAGGEILTAKDHRIAMSAAVGAWRSKNESVIHDTDSVKISYPGFFLSMDKILEY
ncbi:MAG TPA: 3-phosphoshikimate 1-carboxyvinyltransferase [bacterium]